MNVDIQNLNEKIVFPWVLGSSSKDANSYATMFYSLLQLVFMNTETVCYFPWTAKYSASEYEKAKQCFKVNLASGIYTHTLV